MDIHFYYRTDLVSIVCEKLPGVEKSHIELLLNDYSYLPQFHNKYHAVNAQIQIYQNTNKITSETNLTNNFKSSNTYSNTNSIKQTNILDEWQGVRGKKKQETSELFVPKSII